MSTLLGHADSVNTVAVGGDGSVYTGSSDATVGVWAGLKSRNRGLWLPVPRKREHGLLELVRAHWGESWIEVAVVNTCRVLTIITIAYGSYAILADVLSVMSIILAILVSQFCIYSGLIVYVEHPSRAELEWGWGLVGDLNANTPRHVRYRRATMCAAELTWS